MWVKYYLKLSEVYEKAISDAHLCSQPTRLPYRKFCNESKKKKRKFGNESLEEICVSEARSSLLKIK